MLKMKRMIIVVMTILTACLLFAMSFEVNATGVEDDPITLNGLDIIIDTNEVAQNETVANETVANEIIANEIATNSQASQIIQPEVNTSTSETDNTLPQTGVTEDITVMFFIIVCVVSAIYAYKKIRDYNI